LKSCDLAARVNRAALARAQNREHSTLRCPPPSDGCDNERTVSSDQQVNPFDEEAALAELERLRESIQAARQARQRTSDEFAAFIKSFRAPKSTPASEGESATVRGSEPPQQPAPESLERSLDLPDPSPSTAVVPSDTDSVADRIVAPASQPSRRYQVNVRSLGILVIIAVIALGLMLIRRGRDTSPPTTVKAVRNGATPTRNPAVSPPAAVQPAPATPTPAGVAIELRVIRPVWMRVVVDGRKDVEGTVQAGEPMHLAGDHTIVVRVGNGGDVLVSSGTRDEPFGETGQPRTRTFSKP
jgi:hypothetical protein